MILGPFVKSGIYYPSDKIMNELSDMLMNKMPRVVGAVSEKISIELINGGHICLDGDTWDLSSVPLRNFEGSDRIGLLPDHGIYCDDVITVAKKDGDRMLFVTESKGTTLARGFSRSTEAKLWYQLPRTAKNMDDNIRKLHFPAKIGGVISVLVNHYSNSVLINVLDMTTSLAKELPDTWMYPSR